MSWRPDWIGIAWIIFLVFWFAASLRVRRMSRDEPPAEKWARILLMVAAFILLDQNNPQFGVLNKRFVPYSDRLYTVAAALTWIGIGFAIWARYHIGKYWSATVALREGHELIRTGPYSRVRHPIYTGMLLAVLGTALAVGRYRAIVAFVVVLIGFIWKSRKEEALLSGQFGPAFEEHRRHTGFFLPRLSRPS